MIYKLEQGQGEQTYFESDQACLELNPKDINIGINLQKE